MPDSENPKPLEGEVIRPPADNPPLPATPISRRGNIFIGTLNLVAAPAKALTKPLHRHYHRRYHGKYKHAKKLFIFDLALIGLALVLLVASLYFFLVQPIKTYLNINLKQNQPVTIGQTQDFIFQLANLTNYSLANLSLKFEFPRSFILKEFPANFNPATNSLFLDFLKEKQSADLIFKGQVWGAINEKQKIIIHSQFTESKNRTLIEQITPLDLSLTESSLQTEWTLPNEIFVGQNLNLIINYRNDSSEKLAKTILLPTLPDDFEIISSHPNFQAGRWVLENLAPHSRGQIFLTGYLRSFPRPGNVTLTLQTFLENNNQKFLQSSLLNYLAVQEHGLVLKSSLLEHKNFLKPGEEISLQITYQNQNKQTIKDLTVALLLPASLVEKKEQKIEKTEILPGESGTFNLNFKLLPLISVPEKNLTLNLRPLATFYFKDKPGEILRSLATPYSLKISSTLKLQAEARYFTAEGDQLGRGPLPPRVGQTTKYWINWFITTTPNAIKNVALLGHLPVEVSWTGKTNVTEGEPVKYDPVSRTVSWSSSLVPTTPGGRCPCQGIGFEVAITPTTADIGKEITLLDNLTIQGTDEFTGEELSETAPPLTTNLITDNLAKGKGIVQP